MLVCYRFDSASSNSLKIEFNGVVPRCNVVIRHSARYINGVIQYVNGVGLLKVKTLDLLLTRKLIQMIMIAVFEFDGFFKFSLSVR